MLTLYVKKLIASVIFFLAFLIGGITLHLIYQNANLLIFIACSIVSVPMIIIYSVDIARELRRTRNSRLEKKRTKEEENIHRSHYQTYIDK